MAPANAVDQRAGRRRQSQVVGPQRDDDLPGLPNGRQQHDPGSEREEHRPVAFEHPHGRHLRGSDAMLLAELKIGDAVDDDASGDDRRDTDAVGPGQSPQRGRAGTEERAEEDADPHRTAERRQRPGAHLDRHHLRQVGLARQAVDRTGGTDEQHTRAIDHERAGAGVRGRGCRGSGQGSWRRLRRAWPGARRHAWPGSRRGYW